MSASILIQNAKRFPKIFWGLALVFALVVIAAFARPIARVSPIQQVLTDRLQNPSSAHWLGTDDLGRDVWSRMVYGTRVSLLVACVAVSIATIIGTLIGLISGYFGGWIDTLLMRFVDVLLCFPTFFLILMVIAFLKPSITNVMIVIGLTSWTGLARLVRGETLTVKNREYIQAAQSLGLSHWRILWRHILPNVSGPILVSATLGVGAAVLTESGLSFLGLGVQPPNPSWGNMLTAGKDYIYFAWWLSVFPGLAIFITVFAFNILGEGLREFLNPQTSR